MSKWKIQNELITRQTCVKVAKVSYIGPFDWIFNEWTTFPICHFQMIIHPKWTLKTDVNMIVQIYDQIYIFGIKNLKLSGLKDGVVTNIKTWYSFQLKHLLQI